MIDIQVESARNSIPNHIVDVKFICYFYIIRKQGNSQLFQGCTLGVVTNVLVNDILVSKFELQLLCYFHFRTNTLEKDLNLFTHLQLFFK